MNKYWAFFLIIFCVQLSANNSNHIIRSRFASKKLSVDGEINDWFTSDSIMYNGENVKSDNSIVVKSQWDNKYLYILFVVYDKNLQAYQTEQDHPKLFLDDMIEFLIDSRNNKDSCWSSCDFVYHINLLSVKKDDRGTKDCSTNPSWNGNAKYCVKYSGTLNNKTDIDSHYFVEIGIPWREVKRKPEFGLTLGVNFANGDNDCNGRELFDWIGVFPLRSPHLFGTLILTE